MSDIDLNVVPFSDPQASTSSAAAELLQGGGQAQLQSDLTPGSPRITRPRTQRRINYPLHFLITGRPTQRRRRQAARSTQEYNRHLVDPARTPSQEQAAQDGINPLHSLLPPPHSASLYPPGTPGRNEPQSIQFSAQVPAVPSENFTACDRLAQARDHQHLYAPRPDRYLLRQIRILIRLVRTLVPLVQASSIDIARQLGLSPGTSPSKLDQFHTQLSRAPSIVYARRTPLPDPRRRWIADPRNSVLSPFQQRPDLEQRHTTPLQQNNMDRHQSLYNQGMAMMQNETYRANTALANEHAPVHNHVNRLPREQFMEAIIHPTSASLGRPAQNPRRQSVDTILPSHQASTDLQNQLVQRADHVNWFPQDRFMEANMRPPTQNPYNNIRGLYIPATATMKRQIDRIEVLRIKTERAAEKTLVSAVKTGLAGS
ncbi:hypothetical protein GOP47_0022734 [Adiantum capillus-veneris]|uniref:Uncharacterized protein n=1 Tax=Adiantum capillus-veneris TaxID=13818 RepID=A0A9D4U6D7_ADICA|nr:hypothetical protein GOP47_0022734 [Adiantum capillus-veneris]